MQLPSSIKKLSCVICYFSNGRTANKTENKSARVNNGRLEHGCIYIVVILLFLFAFQRKRKAAFPSTRVPAPIKHKFSVFLLFTRLIEVRELRLFGDCNLFVLVGLVVEYESVVGISEILFRLSFQPIICCDPIEKFGSVFLIFVISLIVGLESLVVPDCFFLTRRRDCLQIARAQDNFHR